MRIGFFTDYFIPDVGGTEMSIENYRQALEKQGHTVFVFCSSYGKRNPANEPPTIIRINSLPLHEFGMAPQIIPGPFLWKSFKKYNLDIIHSHTPFMAGHLAAATAHRLKIPHVTTAHTLIGQQLNTRGTAFFDAQFMLFCQAIYCLMYGKRPHFSPVKGPWPAKENLAWRYLLNFANLADRLLVPSQHVADLYKAAGYTKKVYVQNNFPSDGLEEPITLPAHLKGVRLVSMVRHHPEKRLDVLLEALSRLPQDKDWHLILGGNGTERPKLEQMVQDLGLADRVYFTGNLTPGQVRAILNSADIGLLVSYHFDTHSMVVVEAMRAGLAVVYCDETLGEGLSPDNSVLTAPDAEAIAQGLEKLISDPALLTRLKTNSKKTAVRFDPAKLASQLADIYEEAIQAKKAS